MSLAIQLQRIVDAYFFSPLDYVFGKLKKKTAFKKNKIKKILVIKFWALGDSIVLLPTIKALKREFPLAQIDVLAHPRNRVVFEGQHDVHQIIDFGLFNVLKRFRSYDLCIDAEPALSISAAIAFLTSKFRIGFDHGIRKNTYHETVHFSKKQHMVQNYLDFARKVGSTYDVDALMPLSISQKDKNIVAHYLKEKKVTKNNLVVGIAPGVAESVKYRMWPIERFAELADTLLERHHTKVILIDSKSNRRVVEKIQQGMNHECIDAAGLFTLPQSAELIRNCDIVISNDSGLMHVSAAMGTKTIGLFGPNTPVLWGPYGKGNISLWKPVHGCPFLDNTKRELVPKHLTKEQRECMNAISVDDVLQTIEKLKREG